MGGIVGQTSFGHSVLIGVPGYGSGCWELAPHMEEAAHALVDAPHVKDIRNLGLVAGIELEPRQGEPGCAGRIAGSRR